MFYEVLATSNQMKVIARKLQELEMYNAKLKEQCLEEDKPLELAERMRHCFGMFARSFEISPFAGDAN